MQCENCKTLGLSDDSTETDDNHCCIDCILLKSSSSTKQCQVCCNEKPVRDFRSKYSSRCLHRERFICDVCLYQHIKQAFCKMCTDDVWCPEKNCVIRFKYRIVQKILSNNNDKELLEKYERFILGRQLERMNEFIWCAHSCGMGQLNEGGDENNIVRCAKCYKKTCFTHKIKWHEGLTCYQYDATKDLALRATQSWIAQNCKKCPKCSSRIEKINGCDHMTCSHCRYEFCWSCLADYNNIRKDGNHRHESTCKHYAPYH